MDKAYEFGKETASTSLKNFCDDDLLKSIKSAEDAVSNAIHTYTAGGFQLTIFISNHLVFLTFVHTNHHQLLNKYSDTTALLFIKC